MKISELKNKSYIRENKSTNVKTEHMMILIIQLISGPLFTYYLHFLYVPKMIKQINKQITYNVFISLPGNTFSEYSFKVSFFKL